MLSELDDLRCRVGKLVEEIGELIGAILAYDIQDGAARERKQAVAEEIGDVRIVLADIAHLCGIDDTQAALDKLAEARKKHGERP